jgi:hypothetical protein
MPETGERMIGIQQVIPQVAAGPHWLEYVKAFGTPIVAIIGAGFGTFIAHRQMTTAKNKLKLDLFDKRIAVYTAALDLLSTIVSLDHISEERFDEIIATLNGALWLLNRDADTYLKSLRLEVREQASKNRSARTADEKKLVIRVNKEFRERHTQRLKEIFEPFLQLAH